MRENWIAKMMKPMMEAMSSWRAREKHSNSHESALNRIKDEAKTTTISPFNVWFKNKSSTCFWNRILCSKCIDFTFELKLIEIVWNVSFVWNPSPPQSNILLRISQNIDLNKFWLSPSNVPFESRLCILIFVDSKFINHWIGEIKQNTFSFVKYIWTFEPILAYLKPFHNGD